MKPPALEFDNQFVKQLPADPDTSNQRRQVRGACFSRVKPTQVPAAKLVAYSKEAAELLGLPNEYCQSQHFADVFTGNQLLDDMDPYAMCYGGHQFGNWAGQLGDGRAINLGEIRNSQGEHWALQLKGAGITPYSRDADGLAVLRSSVREFLCSEAMFHLGVPTTRALSLTLTGNEVWRDLLYDGHPAYEPGAVVCRVAPSFVRFGSFQIHSSQHNTAVLKKLIDYSIRTNFSHLLAADQTIDNEIIEAWFAEICALTAKMVVHWMRVGFVHGVMNTDNMSILGLTIDYGPYGWLEDYDPDWTPNTTDAQGRRYRFDNQPAVAHWNLAQLAQAIVQLTERVEPLQAALTKYSEQYSQGHHDMMRQKLGLQQDEAEADSKLISQLFEVLQLTETDMTWFFRLLADQRLQGFDQAQGQIMSIIEPAYYQPSDLLDSSISQTLAWFDQYQARLSRDNSSAKKRIESMNRHNPKYVLRNYLSQLAIDDAEKGDFAKVNELLKVLRKPYTEQAGKEAYAEKRPEWARHRAGCSMLSCSS